MGRYIVRMTAHLIGTIVVLTALMLPLAAAQRPAQVRRIAVLELNFLPSASEPTPVVEEFREELRERGSVEGHNLAEVRAPTAFESAFAAMRHAQAQTLLVLGDPFFLPYRQQIADLAAQEH
jgi:hypothetical protein